MSSVRSVIRFEVRAGQEAEFESAFRDAGMLTRPRSIAGFMGGQLLKSRDEKGAYIVIAEWSHAGAYAAWQAQSQQDAPRDAMKRLAATLVDPTSGRVFDIIENSAP